MNLMLIDITYQKSDHFNRQPLHPVLYSTLLQTAVQSMN